MADMSKFLDLVAEYQSAKSRESASRPSPIEKTSDGIAAEALEELKGVLGLDR
jgi:hypothetical protein